MKKVLLNLLLLLMMSIGAVAQSTEVTIGDGSSTSYYLPVNMYFNYSLTQQIYTADEIGMAGTISAISFDYAYTYSFSMSGIKVYMMNTDKSSFTSSTDMVPITGATLVYNGGFSATGSGWVTITLDTPFEYNGNDNLLICVYDPTSGYPGSSYKFKHTTTTEYTSITYYSDSYTPSLDDVSSFSGSKTYNQYHNNIKLDITPAPGQCIKPTELAYSEVAARGAHLAWTNGGEETTWQICLNGNEENLITATTNPFDLTNLTPETAYAVKVRAVCAEDDNSRWSNTVNFTTLPSCPAPTALAYTDVTTNSVILSWTIGAGETAWQICINNNEEELVDVTENPYTLTELAPATTYSIKVRANCGDVDGNSQWTSAVQFTTLCEAISSLPYEQGFESAGVPSCWTKVGAGTAEGTSGASYAHAGSYYLKFSGTTGNNIIALPQIEGDLSSLVLDLYTKPESNTYANCGTFAVGYITDLADATTFVALDTYSYDDWSANQYEEKIVKMTTVPAGSYIALNHQSGASNYYWYVDDVTVREGSTSAEILTYTIPGQVGETTIDSEAGTIAVTVPFTADIDNLVANITISDHAEISDPVIAGEGESRTYTYTVTAEDGTTTKTWEVTITKAPVNHDAFITAFTFAGQKEGTTAEIVSEDETYTVDAVAVWNADLTAIAPVVTISNAATVVPASGDVQDFSQPVEYTVTAEDGTTSHTYIVTIVNDPDACINPATVSISNVTNNSATASWAQAYTETSYLVKVSTEAMTDMTATADFFDGTVEATTKELEGLTGNTQYFVYVQSDCENAEGWTLSSFTTACDAIVEFPWTEGFELTTRPGCWTEETTGTHYWTFGQSGSSSSYTGAHSGSYNASYRHSSSGDKNKLVSPVFDFGEMTVAVLEFWRRNPSWSGDIDYLKVYYRTAGDAEWTLLESYTDASSSWKKESITLVNLSSTYQIAFEATDNYGYGMGLDDVLVREASSEAEILTYSLPTQIEDATIESSDDAGTIAVTVLSSTDMDALVPSYTISENAEISDPVITGEGDVRTIAYTVTAEAGNTKDWTVTVTKAPVNTDAFITSFTFAEQKDGTTAEIVNEGDTYTVNAVAYWDADLTSIAPTVTVSYGGTVTPESGDVQDFSEPVEYTVTAEDGTTTHTYTVTIINDPDACITPYDVFVSNVTRYSATLSWEQAYTETSYRVKVSSEYMNDMTETADVFDGIVEATTKELEDLTANTWYYVYVQSNCDNADSWAYTEFSTPCDPIAVLPYENGFEEDNYYNTPSCWTKVGDGYAVVYDYYVNTGSLAMIFAGTTGNNIIALPEFEENTSSLVLDFYTRPESIYSSSCGTFEVGYITDLNDASTFTAIESYSYDDWTESEFEHKAVYMASAPAGSYMAFNHKANADNYYWFVDDVVVRLMSDEAEIVDFNFPTRMTAPAIDSESGTITTIASYQADLDNLAEEVVVSDYATYVENSATVEGDVKTFEYTVTAEDGTTTKDWTVIVTKAESASTANDILSFTFEDQVGESVIDNEAKTVTAYAEWYVDLENDYITPEITISPMATMTPESGVPQNFNEPVHYTVTAEDGESVADWTVTITNDPNACVNPSYVNVDDVTSASATLAWNHSYNETSYFVKVSTTEMEDMTATADVYDNEVALTGDEVTLALTELTASTTYYVYVQSNCGADEWVETYFMTECDGSAFSVPFVETFDETSASAQCWNIIDANDDSRSWYMGTDYLYQNDVAVYSYSYYNDAEDWLISPKIAVVDGAYLTFDYWDDEYYTERFSVYVMDDPANYAEATQILATQEVNSSRISSIANIDLSAYAGQEIYIGIKCESEADQDVLYIDNFTVTLPTYTIIATAGENGTIDPESAEVTYGTDKMFTITPAEGYRIATVVVDAETDVTENVVAGAEAFFYTFTNVTANHTINVTFEEIPTYTITVEAGEHGTVLYNDALVSTSITVAEGDTPEFVITPDTNYQIDVLTIDGEAVELTQVQLGGLTYTFEPVMANHTIVVTFVEESSADMIEAGSMSIYPNPNNGMFSIDFSNIEGDATYQIIDARGAVVETRDINVMSGEIMNFNHDLRPGAYFVRIINGDKVYVEQIVVE